ncbi:MAG: hypothetical protein Q4B27_04185 [Candidatus Saccharibacteria bacterium]|nr:hypothetical protein [Candidatus Saccharibacteria bacterium]
MKRSIDLQPSHHDTRAEYASTKIEVVIKKDNELYREVKLALCDAKESEHEYEEDIDRQNLRIIKNDQQEVLEEFVQTGERSTVPPGVLQRYQEERAICEATLAEIAEEEEGRVMDKGGYTAEDRAIRTATGLGYAPLAPNKATKQADKMYGKTRLGKDVQRRCQIVKDRIGEINAELAYYMGLTEPPLAVMSEEAAIRIWGKEAVEKAQSAGEVNEPGYIDVFPDDDRTSRSGSKRGYGSRMTPEFIKKDASQRLAEVLVESAGEVWTVQELGDAIYDPSKVQTKLERYKRASILLYSAQRSDRPVMIITEELEHSGLVLQRGQRYTIDERGRRRKSITVYRAVPADIAKQGLTEERSVSGHHTKHRLQMIEWTPQDTTAAAHEAANTTCSEASLTTGSAENEALASSVPYVDYTLAKRALEAARAAAGRQAAEAKEQQEALRAAEVALSAEVRVQIEQLVELAQPLIDSLRENSANDNADKQVFPIQDLPEMGSQYASEYDLEIFLNKARQAGLINKKQLRNRALPSAGEALVLTLYVYDPHTMYDLVRNDAAKRVLQYKFQQAYENRAEQVVNGREGGASAAQENTTS